jgi:hypothetical protein
MADLLRDTRDAIEAGAIHFAAGTGYMGDQNGLSESEFHRKVQSPSGFQSFMRVDPAFLTTRLELQDVSLIVRRADHAHCGGGSVHC